MILRICALVELDDTDDMVQKGLGWLLKETYPMKPREVIQFSVTTGEPTPLAWCCG